MTKPTPKSGPTCAVCAGDGHTRIHLIWWDKSEGLRMKVYEGACPRCQELGRLKPRSQT